MPDFKGRRPLVDLTYRLIGYPYAPRRSEARKALELIEVKAGDRVLDIGCGEGIWSLELARRDLHVVCLDVSHHDVRKAKSRFRVGGQSAIFAVASGTQIPFNDNSFDSVFSINTIEHIEGDRDVVRESYRVLRPGGSLVVSVPSGYLPGLLRRLLRFPEGFKKAFGSDLINHANDEESFLEAWNRKFLHFRVYGRERLVGMFEETGFEELQVFENGGPLAGIAWSVIRGLRFFEWDKGQDRGYTFRHPGVFLGSFPFFWAAYRADDFLGAPHPLGWIIRGTK